jgi:hypothetical protein
MLTAVCGVGLIWMVAYRVEKVLAVLPVMRAGKVVVTLFREKRIRIIVLYCKLELVAARVVVAKVVMAVADRW